MSESVPCENLSNFHFLHLERQKMTKIFASPLAAPPGTDDNSNDGVKAKKDQDLYTVLQPTVFPVPVSQPALGEFFFIFTSQAENEMNRKFSFFLLTENVIIVPK